MPHLRDNSPFQTHGTPPMPSHPFPSRPWQKVGTDLLSWEGRTFLTTVDYYSRFFEVDELTSTTSASVIRKLSAHIARHGIPEIVVSDNGPQFDAEEFKAFAASWDFAHVTSSPGYPQSNALVEKTVQTAKCIMTKATSDGRSALHSILENRNTPVDNLASPAQLLMGRQLGSILPTTNQLLKPRLVNPVEFTTRREELQAKQKSYYDRTAHPLTHMTTIKQKSYYDRTAHPLTPMTTSKTEFLL